MEERRLFEREDVQIPFIYSLDHGVSLGEGVWKEATTTDIGPVLVGGLAFYSEDTLEVGQYIRIALFMDLELKKIWEAERENFPVIYHGTIHRINRDEKGTLIAVLFKGLNPEL